jgi:hypothetical protein
MAGVVAVSVYAAQRSRSPGWVLFVRGTRRDGSVAWAKNISLTDAQVTGLEDVLANAQVLLASTPYRDPTEL